MVAHEHHPETRAEEFAERVYAGQIRKGPIPRPKMEHMREVAMLVKDAGGSHREIAAAYLHDILEDTDTANAEITDVFGKEVCGIILELTDRPELRAMSPRDKKRTQRIKLASASKSARCIKLADMISNLNEIVSNPPRGWNRQRCLDYTAGTLDVASVCVDVEACPKLGAQFMEAFRTAFAHFVNITPHDE